jgi:hypothetical protein
MKAYITLLVSLFVFSGFTIAATCVTLGNGSWNSPSTWSCGAVPTGGDDITIQAGHTVTISSLTNIVGLPVTITIDGIMLFDSPGAKLRLPCGSIIIINSTGSIQSSGVGQPSHSIRICLDDVWSGTDGPLFGPLVIGVVLPIELTYFNAEANGTEIDFSWQTASETDNDFFTVEGSGDGLNWITMERIEGAGTTQEVQDYSYESSNSDQLEYFRLKQTDFNGNYSYSDVVAVQLIRKELIVYPNPSNGRELNINLSSQNSGALHILNSDGRFVYSMELVGQKVIKLNELNLKPGTYMMQIQQSNQFQTKRLIVQ